MRNKYVYVFLTCVICLLTMFSCTSIQNLKHRKTPNEYDISIRQIRYSGTIYGECNLYIVDLEIFIYATKYIYRPITKTTKFKTVFFGKKQLSDIDINEIDKTKNILWNNFDTLYVSYILDSPVTFIKLQNELNEKTIKIDGARIPLLAELYTILNKYIEEFGIYLSKY